VITATLYWLTSYRWHGEVQ